MKYDQPDLGLPEEKQKKIASDAIEAFKADDESRHDWLEMHAKWKRQFYQKDGPINQPWEGSSDESMPLLTEACVQFHARAYKAMFPNRNIVKAIPTIPNAVPEIADRAKRVGNHMSWQLTARDRGYKKNKDRLLLALPLHGSFFTKVYHEPLLGRNVVENVRPEDLVVPYGIGPRDLEDIERKTHVIYMSVNDTRIRAEAGQFITHAEPYRPEQDDPSRDADDEAAGQTLSDMETPGYAKLLEQHTVLDLDGDGIGEPYVVTVDAQSEKLLAIAPRFAMDDEGKPLDNKRPLEFFNHYGYIENPDGFYGLGQGHLIGPINTAVNKLLRQTIDAGTLANIGNMSGFISKQLGVKKGEIRLELGKFTPVDQTGDDIRRQIYQNQFPGPNPSLANVIAALVQRSDRLATVTEALTGQTDKVIQPTALMALIEQGLEVFSTVYERVLTSWSNELQMLYDLNRTHLNTEEYFMVNQMDGTLDPQAVSPDDYADDMMVVPMADPKMTTKQQRLAKAEAEFNYNLQNPLVQQNPVAIHALFQRLNEAMEVQNIQEINPPPNTEPPREDDPLKENMMALMPNPQITPAWPDQDHMEHIQAHEELLLAEVQDGEQGPSDELAGYASRLTPEGKEALTNHVQEHIALMYGVEEAGILDEGQLGEGPGGGAVPEELAGGVPPEMGGGVLMGPDTAPEGTA